MRAEQLEARERCLAEVLRREAEGDSEAIAGWVTGEREALGLSRSGLALELGKTRRAIAHWELGTRRPQVRMLELCFRALRSLGGDLHDGAGERRANSEEGGRFGGALNERC